MREFVRLASACGGPFGWDWGNVPTWISAVITSVSVLVATVTYRANRNDLKRAHASKVAAWVSEEQDGAGFPRYFANVSNTGTSAIRNLRATSASTAEKIISTPELPAGGSVREELSRLQGTGWAVIGKPEIKLSPGDVVEYRAVVMARELELVLQFRDALGREWKILPGGRIKAIRKKSKELGFIAMVDSSGDLFKLERWRDANKR
ncbi:hypothetical protein ABT095_15830 [Kitasatospora sp. NPDC002227]|uniref:hypothetical protein n=1 Tax=Kitasatospora sp. NPDC002227 TaxID=3154773 RepID=UPI0033222231